jgi:hypothetical protein
MRCSRAERPHVSHPAAACPDWARTGCCPDADHRTADLAAACPDWARTGCCPDADHRTADLPAPRRRPTGQPPPRAPRPPPGPRRKATPVRSRREATTVRRTRPGPPALPLRLPACGKPACAAPLPPAARLPQPVAPGRRRAACGRLALRWSTTPTSRTHRARPAWPSRPCCRRRAPLRARRRGPLPQLSLSRSARTGWTVASACSSLGAHRVPIGFQPASCSRRDDVRAADRSEVRTHR